MNTLIQELGVTGWQVVSLVIGATVLFWVFTLVISFFGQRVLVGVSGSSVALMMLVGAVTARAMLGENPTMTAGIIVLAVLFFWEGVFAFLRRHMHRSTPGRDARCVLQDGVIDEEALRHAHLSHGDLVVRLRRAGVMRLQDVNLAIIERNGSLTVVRAGQPVDDEFLADVEGVSRK
ncbi:MAG: DUF421 domain-containing protein [Propionibacteriaceae bacterium]|nr:DUF421 domain-containing protein [Propionibacteriaceae bacterium]